jgi:hypothetical protein
VRVSEAKHDLRRHVVGRADVAVRLHHDDHTETCDSAVTHKSFAHLAPRGKSLLPTHTYTRARTHQIRGNVLLVTTCSVMQTSAPRPIRRRRRPLMSMTCASTGQSAHTHVHTCVHAYVHTHITRTRCCVTSRPVHRPKSDNFT